MIPSHPRPRRTRGLLAGAIAAAIVCAGAVSAVARPVKLKLPPETATLKQTGDPGYAKTDAFCAICHSRDYITTQPPGKGKEFWAAEVTKMVNVYGAPIPETERAVIAEYLAANY